MFCIYIFRPFFQLFSSSCSYTYSLAALDEYIHEVRHDLMSASPRLMDLKAAKVNVLDKWLDACLLLYGEPHLIDARTQSEA